MRPKIVSSVTNSARMKSVEVPHFGRRMKSGPVEVDRLIFIVTWQDLDTTKWFFHLLFAGHRSISASLFDDVPACLEAARRAAGFLRRGEPSSSSLISDLTK